MYIRRRIIVISLVIVSSVAASSGANYIPSDTIVPREAVVANAMRLHVEPRRDPPASKIALATREKKTLAVLLLMLRDGRGAR